MNQEPCCSGYSLPALYFDHVGRQVDRVRLKDTAVHCAVGWRAVTYCRMTSGRPSGVSATQQGANYGYCFKQGSGSPSTRPPATWACRLPGSVGSPVTIMKRQGTVLRFAKWLAPRSLLEATTEDVVAWLDELGLPAATRSERAGALHGFFNWAPERGDRRRRCRSRHRFTRLDTGMPQTCTAPASTCA
jgi:hypothetical protein